MSLATLNIYSDYAYGSMVETLNQQVELFNAATQGAIVLTSGDNMGDFSYQSNWERIPNLVINRDPYTDVPVAALDLTDNEKVTVKVASATPPVNVPAHIFSWTKKQVQEGAMLYGQQLAEQKMQNDLNNVIGAGVVALQSTAGVLHDATAGTLDLGALNTGASKFGDQAQRLVTWVLHSKALFDMYGNSIANADRLFTFGNIKIASDGMGRPLIVTDSPDLHFDNAGTENYHTLGLVPGAFTVEDNGDFNQNVDNSNGRTNIMSTIQSEWSSQFGIKGYSWDTATGGKAPTTAELKTAGNWDQYVSDDKSVAGVVVTSL